MGWRSWGDLRPECGHDTKVCTRCTNIGVRGNVQTLVLAGAPTYEICGIAATSKAKGWPRVPGVIAHVNAKSKPTSRPCRGPSRTDRTASAATVVGHQEPSRNSNENHNLSLFFMHLITTKRHYKAHGTVALCISSIRSKIPVLNWHIWSRSPLHRGNQSIFKGKTARPLLTATNSRLAIAPNDLF